MNDRHPTLRFFDSFRNMVLNHESLDGIKLRDMQGNFKTSPEWPKNKQEFSEFVHQGAVEQQQHLQKLIDAYIERPRNRK